MTRQFGRTSVVLSVLTAVAMGPAALAQSNSIVRPLPPNVVVPQWHASTTPAASVQTTGVEVGVVIVDQVATTTMDISLRNSSGQRQEAELIVPVPDGAVVRGFSFHGSGAASSAVTMTKAEAQRVYGALVAKARDPALLEFAGYNLIRSTVFPVEPGGAHKVRLTYEQVLAVDGCRVDYVLPRSEMLSYDTPWSISAKVMASQGVSTVYSPSHPLTTARSSRNVVTATVAAEGRNEPGSFLLSYLRDQGDVTASLMAYPDETTGGGYFMLLMGLPPNPPPGEATMNRHITLVMDRSGSMSGVKLQQANEAVRQIVAGLGAGDSFNLIVYNHEVDAFIPRSVDRAVTLASVTSFLRAVPASGNTDIHAALRTALLQPPAPGSVPIVLLLTDGLPTAGITAERDIRRLATAQNPHGYRVFTFGVGFDVNAPLLEGIAEDSRGKSTFILPSESIETKVADVFKTLATPVLTDPVLVIEDASGWPTPYRLLDVLPAKLPDLYADDQLVLFGRFGGDGPIRFELRCRYLGHERAFTFAFDDIKPNRRNSFVPRLWASREIAELTKSIRDRGIDPSTVQANIGRDPALRALVDEIVRLSTQFGILTEYTAFLAREGSDLTKKDEVMAQATRNFVEGAVQTRGGAHGVSQAINRQQQQRQKSMNRRNVYQDEQMNRVSTTTVQQIADLAFYRRGSRWLDSRIIDDVSRQTPVRVIEPGSDAYRRHAERLQRNGQQAMLALDGEVLLLIDGETVLIKRSAQ